MKNFFSFESPNFFSLSSPYFSDGKNEKDTSSCMFIDFLDSRPDNTTKTNTEVSSPIGEERERDENKKHLDQSTFFSLEGTSHARRRKN